MPTDDAESATVIRRIVYREVELGFSIGLMLWVISLQRDNIWFAALGSAIFIAALWDSNRRKEVR